MAYFTCDPYEDEDAIERNYLRKLFGEDWVDHDDPYSEAFDGHPDAYWNID